MFIVTVWTQNNRSWLKKKKRKGTTAASTDIRNYFDFYCFPISLFWCRLRSPSFICTLVLLYIVTTEYFKLALEDEVLLKASSETLFALRFIIYKVYLEEGRFRREVEEKYQFMITKISKWWSYFLFPLFVFSAREKIPGDIQCAMN